MTPEEFKKRADERYKRAEEIANAMNHLFEGEHIESIGNAQLIIMTHYIASIPTEARGIFINGVIGSINKLQAKLNKAKH